MRQARLGVRPLQIADLVIKHGLGSVLDLVGVSPRMFRRPPAEAPEERSLPIAHRVRLLLQDLGPTFVKLGQIASTRSDLLSEEFIRELRKLQDEVEPLPFDVIAQVIVAELGRPLNELFLSFEEQPLASASIGQVHRARTPDGRNVVVKVQRPGVEEVIRNDMAILGWAARRLEA
ncbi:MAG: AarF/ABC1/UbiB kinase family protein, partial [Chloroflexi bacterium]|nr:AarF/ABC1/UbiB kinase family protein [Chloroflexota bacterium]